MKIFANVLHPDQLDSIIQGSTARSLALINQLTKISNSPELLRKKVVKEEARGDETSEEGVRSTLQDLIPNDLDPGDIALSGRLI